MGDLQNPWYSRNYQEPESTPFGQAPGAAYGMPAPSTPAIPTNGMASNPPATPSVPVPQGTKNKPKQTAPSVDNSGRTTSNARFPQPGKQMPGGTPEWYGRATQQMPPKFTPPPGSGLQPPRPDAPERRRWLR